MELADFLRQRYDEDEQIARRVLDGGWTDADFELTFPDMTSNTRSHIARHDPARVLADIEAKRRVVERHHDFQGWCAGCGNDLTNRINDCPELRDLASVYADHPDYRQEWKP